MEQFTTDILTAAAVVVNGIPQGLLALSVGFAAFPTALGFIVGIAGSLFFNSVATVSFQAETITLAGRMGKNLRERLSIVFWGAVFLLVPSLMGLNEKIVQLIGPTIVVSMMAGVGIMLAMVSIDMLNSEKYSGSVSLITGLAVWFATFDLAKTIIISVLVSTIAYNILKKMGKVNAEHMDLDLSREKFTLNNIEWKIWKHPNIVINGLALTCLNIGANISFGKITGSIAGVNANIDHLAIYSALADMFSSYFGGCPLEAIISGTATAPNPLRSSVIMMAMMAVILLLKLLPTIGKYLHSASIAGFLFVLGTFVTFATNIQGAIASVPEFQGGFGFTPWGMVVGVTVLATARWDPFFGLLAGVAVKLIFSL